MRPSKVSLSICLVLVLILSLVTIWSTTPELFLTQLSFILAGSIIVYLLMKTDMNLLFSFSWGWYILSIALLLITMVIGRNVRGSVRWIDLGLFNLQTSEIIKPFLAIFYANYLTTHKLTKTYQFLTFLLVAAVPVLIVAKQPDLGSSLTLFSIPLALLIFSENWKKIIIWGTISLLVLVPLGSKLLHPYQIQRIESFVNPYRDPKGAGYHVIQANIAIGSGGILGKGVRLGTQSHLNFLPERHTDFVFASFVEEFGLLGAVVLLTAYTTLLSHILKSASLLRNQAQYLLSMSIFSVFFFQGLVNIGMNLGMMPVTGITLPLFSYGGSSLLSFSILIGLYFKLLDLIAPFEL